MKDTQPHSAPSLIRSARALWLTLTGTLLVAAFVFVGFVMPAEFGEDPTGIGKLTGLSAMAGYDVAALSLEGKPPVQDRVQFPLSPFESVEYKYELAAAQAVLFRWTATGEVLFDFHSEEEGTDPEDAISFSTGRGVVEQGTYVASSGSVPSSSL